MWQPGLIKTLTNYLTEYSIKCKELCFQRDTFQTAEWWFHVLVTTLMLIIIIMMAQKVSLVGRIQSYNDSFKRFDEKA